MRKSLIMLLSVMMLGGPLALRTSLAQNADAARGAAEDTPMQMVKGKVLERIDAQPYTYLKLSTSSGEVWAAVPQTTAAVGSEVTVTGAFPMTDFESKTLKRKFDVVYFGTLGGTDAMAVLSAHGGSGSMPDELPAAPKPGGAMPPGHPPISDGGGIGAQHKAAAAGPSDSKDVKVDKAIVF